MKFRLAAASLLIALASGGVAWITVQPVFGLLFQSLRAMPALADPSVLRWETVLPLLLGLDLVLSSGIVFLVLYFSFGLPLARAEETIEQIASENVEVASLGGPLMTRLARSLKGLSGALLQERTRNKQQLSELKAANEALLRLQAELVASDRLATVGKLAAGVAHEVGNPLAGILGYLSVMRMRSDQPEAVDLVDRVEREVQRIDEIVRSLLELGRPSRGKAQPVDVRPVIDSCVTLLRAGLEFKDVRLVVDCPPSLFLRAEGGPLAQVLVNLLLNAAQAMQGKGEVTVRASAADSRGRISVEDQGPGIPPDVLEHLFEPFYTTKPAGKGTGLGLAVSRHLLAQFEGDLAAENSPGGGARLTISLPAV